MTVLGMDDKSKQEQEWNLRSKKAWSKSKAITKWKVWAGEKIEWKWWRYKNDKQNEKRQKQRKQGWNSWSNARECIPTCMKKKINFQGRQTEGHTKTAVQIIDIVLNLE